MEDRMLQIAPNERREILIAYRKLLRASSGILKWEDVKQIRKAIELSLDKVGLERSPSGKLSVLHSL